ncbi:MAG: hypothetical protein AB8G99_03635, partial [Planctomycetaceae bacterium]
MSGSEVRTQNQDDVAPDRTRALIVGVALFFSGAAGLINQVVWQRSLKVFLGGSEAICSTVVVLVFMAGLGIGSIWMSRLVSRLKSPLRSFAGFEVVLAVVNFGICLLLMSDITDSVFGLQRVVVTSGLPLIVLYAILATVVLAVPCLLMGATMPLAAESLQRSLRLKDSRLLGLLFFVNTAGSVLGTIVSGGWMMSHLGLSVSLFSAVGLNLLAGVVLYAASSGMNREVGAKVVEPNAAPQSWRPRRDDVLGFGLGFCSLAFEMYLFRLLPLRHEPLPFTFAAVLGGFLMFWSIGAALSSRNIDLSVASGLKLCAAGCVLTLAFFSFDGFFPVVGTISLTAFIVAKTPYFLPCVLFGFLFSRVAGRAAKSWGADVGRFYSWNTLGSCLGVMATTFVGYEIPAFALVFVIALLIFALTQVEQPSEKRIGWLVPVGLASAVTVVCLTVDITRIKSGQASYFGRDGVVVVQDDGDLFWDGLWHSRLSKNDDHVGTHNWNLAAAPVWCHSGSTIEDVCVIGVGTGITATTLAKIGTVKQVDAYDISHVLEEVYDRYPEGTLRLRENERINFILQDARTGLALNSKKYDVIQTQPLYLKQSGSSLLNSQEFLQLVQSRLKKSGVFCVYSNGTPEQAFALRETADSVFAHRESFFNGYLLVLSNDKIDVNQTSLAAKLERDDPFWTEVRECKVTSTAGQILQLMDSPRLPGGDGTLIVTDDRPILEYPDYLFDRLRKDQPTFSL